MTTEELERDLKMLAEPREEDERLRLATRALLDQQMLVRPRRRVRSRLRFGSAAAAVAVAAIAIAIVSLGWPGGSAGPSAADAAIVRHALRAIALPANAIVHVKETGVQNGTPVAAEWWQQTSAPHALRMIKGRVGREVESAEASTPAMVDPIAGVREQLANGGAQVAGKATIDGTPLYKIELPTGVTAYFDTTNYQPRYLDNPQRDGSVVRARVVTYEELPTTPDNAELLRTTAQDAPVK
jgi:hypothetical protein